MKDQYCFDISFPNIEFDSYILGHKESALVHHAHLLPKENEIEIRILFDSKTYFGKKLSRWVSKINWKKFGSFLQITNENQNDGLQKIDLAQTSLLSITNGSTQFDGNFEYVSIKIDCVKFYWNPSAENINTGEFYLNEAGFNVVKDFYTPLLGINGEFSFNRMNGMDFFIK